MELLQNEKIILVSNGGSVVLTDQRIFVSNKEYFGKSYEIIIFLEDISSIEVSYKSSIIFLILAGVLLLGGQYFPDIPDNGIIIATLILIALWWLTKKRLIIISSNGGGKALIPVSFVSKKEVKEFILQVSKTKSERISMLGIFSKN